MTSSSVPSARTGAYTLAHQCSGQIVFRVHALLRVERLKKPPLRNVSLPASSQHSIGNASPTFTPSRSLSEKHAEWTKLLPLFDLGVRGQMVCGGGAFEDCLQTLVLTRFPVSSHSLQVQTCA
jgi:hypothetical protein